MEELVKKDLPSGAKMEINPAPFAAAKKLYKAIAAEAKGLKLNMNEELDINFFKDILLTALSSDSIEAELWECFKRCTYNGMKVTPETFEPIAARGDYLPACFEVAVVNVSPFMKPLYAQYAEKFQKLLKTLQERWRKTTG